MGRGMSMMPAMKLVQPRRKKSQWKPPGFLRGNCLACAATLLWFWYWWLLAIVCWEILGVGMVYVIVVE